MRALAIATPVKSAKQPKLLVDKEKALAAREKEKAKAKEAKLKAQEKAQAAKERQAMLKEKERVKAQAAKERQAMLKEKERMKARDAAARQREKEKAMKARERSKLEQEKAKEAKERERAKQANAKEVEKAKQAKAKELERAKQAKLKEAEKAKKLKEQEKAKQARIKARKARDPNQPRRPASAYMLFSRAQWTLRPADVSVTDFAKLTGAKWNTLPPHEKRVFEDQANALKAKYTQDKESYQRSLPVLIKRAKSPYIFFFLETRPLILQEMPTLTASEAVERVAALWRELPTEKKAQYNALAAEDQRRYEEEKSRA